MRDRTTVDLFAPPAPQREDAHAQTGFALSIQQPWSHLIVHGFKPVENRGWPTNLRGQIWIHAGKRFDDEGYEWVLKNFPSIAMPRREQFERGGLVGRVRMIDCVTRYDSPWFFGPYGFVFADAKPIPFQRCRGKLGFFRPQVDPDA